MKRRFPFVDVRVCRDYRFRWALPQLLDIAEHRQGEAVVQVVVQRTKIGFFTGLEVVRPVPLATVHVGENDEAITVGIQSPRHVVRPPVQMTGSPHRCSESGSYPRVVELRANASSGSSIHFPVFIGHRPESTLPDGQRQANLVPGFPA